MADTENAPESAPESASTEKTSGDAKARTERLVLFGFVNSQQDRYLDRKWHEFEKAATSSAALTALHQIRKRLMGLGRWSDRVASAYEKIVAEKSA